MSRLIDCLRFQWKYMQSTDLDISGDPIFTTIMYHVYKLDMVLDGACVSASRPNQAKNKNGQLSKYNNALAKSSTSDISAPFLSGQ